MPRQQPRLPSTVGKSAAGKATIAVKERQAYPKLPVQTHDLVGKSGSVDADLICRAINMVQDNIYSATAPARNNPLGSPIIIQAQAMTSGTPVQIRHGLGAYVGNWTDTRSYAGSQPFQAVEASYPSTQWPKSLDPTQWIVLIPSSTGTYNIAFYPA